MKHNKTQNNTNINHSLLWDSEALNPMTEHVRGKYLTQLFLTAVNKSITLVKTSHRIKILKVDLWNEGIDLERNILKHYPVDNFELCGIDISHKVCKSAKKNTPPIKISTASITALPFKEKEFDTILDLSTSDHLPPEKIQKIVSEYSRCLKNNGTLTLIFDWWGFVWRCYLKYIEKIYKRTDTNFLESSEPKRYIHEIQFIKQELKKHFEIKGEYCIDYTGWTWNRFTKPIWRKLPESAYSLLLRIEFSKISKFIKPLAKQYVIIAQKND